MPELSCMFFETSLTDVEWMINRHLTNPVFTPYPILSYPYTTAAAANPFQFITLALDNIFPLKDESYRNVPQTSEQSVNPSLLYCKTCLPKHFPFSGLERDITSKYRPLWCIKKPQDVMMIQLQELIMNYHNKAAVECFSWHMWPEWGQCFPPLSPCMNHFKPFY